jgi:hypothetical protein
MLELAGFRMETMVSFEKGFIFEDWCNRAGLPELESRKLEASMLSAPSVIKKYFKFEETQQGRLVSFEGESVYIQAIKDSL